MVIAFALRLLLALHAFLFVDLGAVGLVGFVAVAVNRVRGATEQKPGLRMAGVPSLVAATVHRLLLARFRSARPLTAVA
jgi:hypothetical protein